MDIDQHLKRGSDVSPGQGLRERKAEKRAVEREVVEDVVSLAERLGLVQAAQECGVSIPSAAKMIARALKRSSTLTAEKLIDPSKITEIESLILSCNTSSISRIVTASAGRFNEGEIRIVKAQIEKNGVSHWDC